MDKCQHNRQIVNFCIYQYCSSKEIAGCEECMRKYHSHVGNAEYLKIEQTEKFIEKFNVENLVKPKCRQFQELVFSFFTQIKNQISQSIDIVAKSMVNKVGYPLLSNLNHLTVFKRLKNREYKKLSSKEVKKFCEESKKLDSGTITRRDRQLYIEEIKQNYEVIESFQKLMKDYDQLVKKFYKNFKHDLVSFKKIEDLKKYLNSVLKIGNNDKKQQNEKFKQIDSKKLLSNLETSPSSQTNLKPVLKLIDRQSQNGSALQKPKQSERTNRINKQSLSLNARNKEKNSQLFSIQKEIKAFEFDSFDQKEKEISQRKQKLMRMMNSREKSIGNHMQNSLGKKLNSLIIPPPQLNFENSTPQKSKKNQKVERRSQIQNKTVENYFKIQIAKNIDISGKRSSSYQSSIKRQDSISSLKQEIFLYSKDSKNTIIENQCDQKYKYALKKLPSSQSNSSQQDILIETYFDGVQDFRINKMTESSPTKIDLNRDRTKKIEIATNQQKSAYLYFHSLDLPMNQAIKNLKESISCCTNNISAAKYLSFIYLKNDKPKECLNLCNDYLGLLSKFEDTEIKIDFINNKAAALNVLGRYSQSIMILEEYLVHFEHAKMYKNLGDAYFFIGINQKCQYNYEKAVKLDSNFDEAMYNLAACLFTQGNFYGANIWIDKALEINKRNKQYETLSVEIKKRMEQVAQQHLNQAL